MPRPSYLPTDTYRELQATGFQNRTERDLWSTAFSLNAEAGIQGLSSLVQEQPQPAQQPDVRNLEPAPLPVVISPRPGEAERGPRVGGAAPPQPGRQQADALGPEFRSWQTAGVEQPQQPVSLGGGGYDIGPGVAWGGGGESLAAGPASGGQVPAPSGAGVGPPERGAPSDFTTYVRQAAAARGLDPDQVAAVMGKEGPEGYAAVGRFDTGTSYGPLQLHYAGGSKPTAGMGDDFTRDTGIDLRTVDPRSPAGIAAHQRAVDYALDRLSKTGDFREWYGADPALGSRFTPVTRVTPSAAAAPASMPPDGVPTAVADGAGWRERWGKDLTPNQINETLNLGLSWDAAIATCGIAASVAFARANGRTPTFKEALDLAQSTGEWNQQVGMARGTAGQIALLKGLGVDAEARPVNEQEIARTVSAGQPVQLNAHGNGGHFYVAQGVRQGPGGLEFDFGNSAAILKRSGGNTWYRLDELEGLGVGTPSEAIYLRPGGAAR